MDVRKKPQRSVMKLGLSWRTVRDQTPGSGGALFCCSWEMGSMGGNAPHAEVRAYTAPLWRRARGERGPT